MKSFIILYLSFILLLTNNFLCYVPIKEQVSIYGPYIYILNLCLLFGGKNKIPFDKNNKNVIVCMALLFVVSAISCIINRGQGFYGTIRMYIPYLSLLSIYLILHRFAPSKENIIKMFTCLAVGFILINIYQQFLAGAYLFGSRPGEEIRMGLKRFAIYGDRLCFIPLFYYLQKWVESKNTKNILFVLFFFVGIFMQLERMLIFGVICGVIFFLLKNKKMSVTQWVIAGVCLFAFYSFVTNSSLEGSFAEKTEANTSAGDDDIRMQSITYYTTMFQTGIGSILFGNGLAYHDSSYGDLITRSELFGFYRVDIGAFGEFNTFGLLYSIFMIICLIKYSFLKRFYVKSMYAGIFSVMLFSYVLNGVVDMEYRLALWPFLLYLIDLEKENQCRINR